MSQGVGLPFWEDPRGLTLVPGAGSVGRRLMRPQLQTENMSQGGRPQLLRQALSTQPFVTRLCLLVGT